MRRRYTSESFSSHHFSKLVRISLIRAVTLSLVMLLTFGDFLGNILPGRIGTFFEVEEVQAATGDFAIFRESAGGSTISSTGTPFDVTWDTTVKSNSNIQLQVNNSDIDLADGGKYLVLYNTWVHEGSAGGANRRNLNSYLTLNSVQIPYGRSSGYIRDTEGVTNTYINGGTIVNAAAGDDLQVHLQRDDTNTTAGTQIQPSTNGISVLKLPDNADYLRIRRAVNSTTIAGFTAFTDVQWDTADEVDTNSFGFTPTSANMTLKGASGKSFLVTANLGLLETGTQRLNYEMRLMLGGVEVPGSRVTTYLRGADGAVAGQLVYTGLVTKSSASDQTLTIQVRRESTATATTVIVGGRSAVSIMSIPSTAEIVRLTDTTGTQTTAATDKALTFNTQQSISSSAFSHSLVTNTDRVEIDLAGDYLFFAAGYTQTTVSGNDRQPFKMDWKVNGSPTNRASFGAYNRANATFTAGASAGTIISSLTTSDYVSLTHVDETGAPVDSTFPASRVSLQGIALNANFFGLDVLVSSAGTQTTDVTIPTANVYSGGRFLIDEETATRNVTNITIRESGSVAADTALNNIKLFYEVSTTSPYDCSEHTYNGTETQFGTTDSNGFSGPDGTSSFADTVSISPTRSLCVYPVYDVLNAANDGETLELSIVSPASDIIVTGGGNVGPPSTVSIAGTTNLRNVELTQAHYQWLNDDGIEGSATSIDGAEDTTAAGFASGVRKRLRVQVSAEGSTSGSVTSLRLEYAQKITTCADAATWVDVGQLGGDWDMGDSTFITNGQNTTDLSVANGGTTNENTTHLTPNGALLDTSSETGALTFGTTNFLELEYSIAPTGLAPQGNTYCFRISDSGTELRNYSIYPEGTLTADIDVSGIGAHVASVDSGTNDFYSGGTFMISRTGTNRTLTSVTVTETGTVDASNLSNPRLFYDLDTTVPRDCAGETYAITDSSVSGTSFSTVNGTTTFDTSGSGIVVGTTQTFCGYLVVDVSASTSDSETIVFSIDNPSAEVIVTSSSVGPSTGVGPTGETTIAGPVLTQTHYHWRNDDGSETAATSATGGNEDTALDQLPKQTTKRLRVQVSNEGGVAAASTQFRLEYGTKITNCSTVGTWIDVAAVGGAWDMSASPNIADGNTTNVGTSSLGEMTDENTNFVGTGALRESTSESGSMTLATTDFTELEYAVEATEDSGYNTTYCFRVTKLGSPVNTYLQYPETTTRQKQDFYIQRGNATVTGTSLTLNAGSNFTAPASSSRAFVRITNSQITGAGNALGDTNQNAVDVTAYISDQSDITSSFTISRPAAAASDTRVSWEIIEFIGLAGTDNEMIVRDVGELSLSATNFQATGGVVSGVADDSDIVVFITGQLNNDAARNDYNDGMFTAEWDSVNDQPVLDRADADTSVEVGYAVVEFVGVNWVVQRVEHTYTSAGSPEVVAITPIPATNRGFVHTQKRIGTGLNGLDELGQRVWLSSMGALTFQLRSGADTPGGHTAVAWVISNNQNTAGAMSVYEPLGTIDSGGTAGAAVSIAIGPELIFENTSIFATNDSNGTGTAYPRVINGFSVASSTHIEIWRSNTGQPIDFRTMVVDWPVADTSVRQNYYRFYADNNALDPTDAWPAGATDLGENTSITSADDPLGDGEVVRMRMSLKVNNANLPENTAAFKLQYGLSAGSCSAIITWTDVGAEGSGEIWRGYANSVTDGTALATSTPAPGTLNLSVSDVAGTFEQENISAINPFTVPIGDDVEYDWVVQHNGAAQRSDYCFRMVYSDDNELDSYTNYPAIRTTGYTPVIGDWRWYGDETNETPTTALAAENVAPANLENIDIVKLRVSVPELENSTGNNVKFSIQYSEYADFSDGGITLTSTSTCQLNSLWCYANAAGVNDAVVDSAVISSSDSCVAGVGNGCGTHNETATSSSSHTQPASSNMEFEFTIRHAGARVNTVYYFRLYDEGLGEPLVASGSYPSLVTEGAYLDFQIAGVPSGTVIAGLETDATTTANSVNFDSIIFNVEQELAQQLTVLNNATEGYQVLMFSDQQLTDPYGNVIDAITSTNATPASWAVSCSGVADGCFGYHSTDATLKTNSSRFAPDDSFAAFETSPQEIMYSSLPTSDTAEVLYRIVVSENLPGGVYQTNIQYIAVPVY